MRYIKLNILVWILSVLVVHAQIDINANTKGTLVAGRGGTGATTVASHTFFGNCTGGVTTPAFCVVDYSYLSGSLPNPGPASKGGIESIDCTGTGHVLSLNIDGTVTCSADSGGGAVSSVFTRTGAVTAQSGDYTFSQIGSTPTTLSGYGITDGANAALSNLTSPTAFNQHLIPGTDVTYDVGNVSGPARVRELFAGGTNSTNWAINTSGSLNGRTGGSPVSITLRTGMLTVIAIFGTTETASVSSITDNAVGASNTWTLAPGSHSKLTADGRFLEIWYTLARSPALTVTVNLSSGATTWSGYYYTVSGPVSLDTAAALSDQTSSTTPSAPPITTANGGEFIVAAIDALGTVTGLHSGSSFTNEYNFFSAFDVAHLTSNSAVSGSYQATWDQNSSAGYAGSIAAFIFAGSPGEAISAQNTAASTASAPIQPSPYLHWGGHVWNTTAVAADNWFDWITLGIPGSSSSPRSILSWRTSRTSTSTPSYTEVMTLSSNGTLSAVAVNAQAGFSQLGTATSGHVLRGNGSEFVDAALACSDLSTPCITANQTVTLSGDVSGSGATAITTVLGNIPAATPMAGSLLATAIVAPSTPAAGKGSIYVDSTTKNVAVKDDAGVVKHGVQTDTGAANNYISAISDAGAITKSRPTCSTLSDAVASCSTDATNATNIASGTLPAGRLPNPTASTLGGIESLDSVASKWINAISTSGVPSATQPSCADLTTPCITAAVTSVNTTSPITGGPITGTGTIGCATCAIGPGSSTTGHLATFAGTDGVTLADGGAVPTGTGTVTSVATTSPITGGTFTTSGTLACATCVTSAAALTSGQLVAGAGLQASAVTNLTGDVTTSGGVSTTLKHTYSQFFGDTSTAFTCTSGGGTTTFVGVSGAPSTTETAVIRWIPEEAYTISRLYVQNSANVPASQTFTVAVMDASAANPPSTGSAQVVTCAVGAAASSCNDTAHSFTTTAGHLIDIRVICSGGTSAYTTIPQISIGYK